MCTVQKKSKGWVIIIQIVSSMMTNMYESSMFSQPYVQITHILIISNMTVRDYNFDYFGFSIHFGSKG